MTAKGAATTIEPERSLQRQGRRAAEARATVPDAVYTRDVAVSGELPGDQIVAAFARALRQHAGVNAAYRDAQLERYERVNIGLVLPDGDGSTAVTIADADTKTAADIAAEREELATKVADGSLTAPETSGATASATDLSATGVTAFAPVLTPPHAAALGIGGRRPDGTVTLTLTCDTRVVSPFTAAAVLDALAGALA